MEEYQSVPFTHDMFESSNEMLKALNEEEAFIATLVSESIALLALARACENAIDRWSIEDFDAILRALEAAKQNPSLKKDIEKT